MLPALADDEAIVRAAERTVRRILRGQYVGYTRDDLLQEGRLAVLVARRLGRVPDDTEHARRYLARRAQGAMLDSVRAARRQMPQQADELTTIAPLPAANIDPSARLRMRGAVELLYRRCTPRVIECVELLATGLRQCDVAREMGVSESRVVQMRKHAGVRVGAW